MSRATRATQGVGAQFGRRSPCPVFRCQGARGPAHFCCVDCWHALPEELRNRITEERKNCRLSGIAHSQELLALRDEALALLSRNNSLRATAHTSNAPFFRKDGTQ